jgi:hypothetical protein
MATHLLLTPYIEPVVNRPWIQQVTVFGAVQRVRAILLYDRVFFVV